MAVVPGATLFLSPVQDIRVGGRVSNSQYQYTLQSDSLQDLNEWAPKLVDKLKSIPILLDVNSDLQVRGLQTTSTSIAIRPPTGRKPANDRYALYSAFRAAAGFDDVYGDQSVSRGAGSAPKFQQNPMTAEYLCEVYERDYCSAQRLRISASTTSLTVNHQGQFPAITLSFTLAPGVRWRRPWLRCRTPRKRSGCRHNVRGGFQGQRKCFKLRWPLNRYLILAALLTVYIVLGMLYESYVHPITILSTLPSAGVGAILALMFCHTELSIIALIGIILLIGIVKKNAIMMIDFALQTERKNGLQAEPSHL